MNHKIEIPEMYLVHIAACGRMGSDELMDLMKHWAYSECIKLGLKDKVDAAQKDKIKQLRGRLSNVLGDDAIVKIDKALKDATGWIIKNASK